MPANAGTNGNDRFTTLKTAGPPIGITAAGSTFRTQLPRAGPSDSGSGPNGDVVFDNPTSSRGSEPRTVWALVTTVTESPSHGRPSTSMTSEHETPNGVIDAGCAACSDQVSPSRPVAPVPPNRTSLLESRAALVPMRGRSTILAPVRAAGPVLAARSDQSVPSQSQTSANRWLASPPPNSVVRTRALSKHRAWPARGAGTWFGVRRTQLAVAKAPSNVQVSPR